MGCACSARSTPPTNATPLLPSTTSEQQHPETKIVRAVWTPLASYPTITVCRSPHATAEWSPRRHQHALCPAFPSPIPDATTRLQLPCAPLRHVRPCHKLVGSTGFIDEMLVSHAASCTLSRRGTPTSGASRTPSISEDTHEACGGEPRFCYPTGVFPSSVQHLQLLVGAEVRVARTSQEWLKEGKQGSECACLEAQFQYRSSRGMPAELHHPAISRILQGRRHSWASLAAPSFVVQSAPGTDERVVEWRSATHLTSICRTMDVDSQITAMDQKDMRGDSTRTPTAQHVDTNVQVAYCAWGPIQLHAPRLRNRTLLASSSA